MPKLPQGFRKRGDGYEYRFAVAKGRRSVSGATIAGCIERAEKLKSRLSGGLKVDADKITLNEYFEEWIRAKEPQVKPATIYSYRKKYKPIGDILGDHKVQSIDRRDVLALQNRLYAHLASSTTNYYMSLLKSILEDAVTDEVIIKNPCQRIKAVRKKEDEVLAKDSIHRALTDAELKTFFALAKRSWYYELFAFLVSTGLRVGEAGALTWSDIDGNMIKISKTVSRNDNKTYVISKTPKTDAGNRQIPMTSEVEQILRDQKSKVAQLCGIKYVRATSRIFVSAENPERIMTNSMADHAIDYICKQAQLTHFSVHALRDTFATKAIEAGMQPNTLKEILGHTDIRMTMNIYAHVHDGQKQKEMEKIKMVL